MMRSIPFYPNDLDAMHCLEACVSSALGYFGQPASFTAADVEKITGFQPGKGTWQFRSYVNLASLGYEIRVWDPIDLRPFTEDTFAYLVEIAGEEMAEDLWENSDVGTAVEDAKLVIENRAIDFDQFFQRLPIWSSRSDEGPFVSVRWTTAYCWTREITKDMQ